jgi:potassium channel subfamily K
MPSTVSDYTPFVGEKSARTPFYQKLTHDQWLSFFAVVYLAAGMFYLHFHNGFNYVTAVYALVEIVTTIGYGDVDFVGYYDKATDSTHASDFGKLFMAFYVIVSLTLIAGVVMKLAERATDAAEDAFRSKMRSAQMKASGLEEEDAKNKFGIKNELIAATVIFAAMVGFGTLFYGTVEACTCSFGRSAVPNCKETTYEECVDGNGYVKSYVDAFYMSCISLTTVGFGDFAPKSEVGRGVGIFWLFIGVAVTGNFISEITASLLTAKQERKNYSRISHETFSEIDVDGNGTLSKYEFVSFVLLQYGLVKKEDLDEIIAMYDALDTSGDGVVTFEDIEGMNM